MSESIEQTKPDFSLTAEQQKEVDSIFPYQDGYELTEEDFARLDQIFTEPEDFLLLRKVLGMHTPNEAGLTYKSPHKLLEASLADREAYAIEHAVSMLADERIRQALLNTYMQLRGWKKTDMKKNLEQKNQDEFEEEKRTEKFEEEQEEAKRTLGVNL
jgi:hypothetical protein